MSFRFVVRHKHDPAVRQPINDPETHYATHGADVFNVSGIGGLIYVMGRCW